MIHRFHNWLVAICFLICLIESLPGQSFGSTLVAESSNINCEVQRSSVDIMLNKLNNSSGDYGLIRIHGAFDNPISPYLQKKTIENHLVFRKFDLNRINFVLGDSEPILRTELWIRASNTPTEFGKPMTDIIIDQLPKPIMVHVESWEQGTGCEFRPDIQFYTSILTANSDINGRIIIKSKSLISFERSKAKITRTLEHQYKIARNRFEFGYIKSSVTDTEYWYIP